MMGFLTDGKPVGLNHGCFVYQAYRAFSRIEHDNHLGFNLTGKTTKCDGGTKKYQRVQLAKIHKKALRITMLRVKYGYRLSTCMLPCARLTQRFNTHRRRLFSTLNDN